MGDPRYQVLEHTADLRMLFHGADMNSLLTAAAYGFTREMLGFDPPAATGEPRHLELESLEPDLLLRSWLAELLYLIETEHVIFTEWDVGVTGDGGLKADIRGIPLPQLPREPELDIKAVTYHGLRVEESVDGLEAEVIFDL